MAVSRIVADVQAALSAALHTGLADPATRFAVAFSGGVDSSVLLHAAVALRNCSRIELRALHVNHHLHHASGEWSERCAGYCAELGVPFRALDITVPAEQPHGPEAAARDARYAALVAELAAGEVLLTAHNLDDQAETFLLRLMRGAGPRGLAAIPDRRPVVGATGGSMLVRPLLDLPRRLLREYAAAVGITAVEDPGNADARFDRNYVRAEVVPILRTRWPAAVETIGRAARLQDESSQLLDELARIDARSVVRRRRVSVTRLARLPPLRQRNLLRELCRERLGSVPSEAQLAEGLTALTGARVDRTPELVWGGGAIRRFRDELHFGPARCLPGLPISAVLTDKNPVALGPETGRLRLRRTVGAGIRAEIARDGLRVAARRGGERIRPAGSAHARTLKKLLQEHGVLPWMRDSVPLLLARDRIAAVGDLWIAAEFAAGRRETGYIVRWEGRPRLS